MAKTALVTGGSGFVASWVIHYLLRSGYQVTATIRNRSKWQLLEKYFGQQIEFGQLTFVKIEDLTKAGALDGKLDGIESVFAVAAPRQQFYDTGELSHTVQENIKEMIDMAVNTYTSAVRAGVKRVVFTGSIVASIDLKSGVNRDYTYTEKDGVDGNGYSLSTSEFGNEKLRAMIAAKALTEKAVWDQLDPRCEAVFLHPAWVVGPHLLQVPNRSKLNYGNTMFCEILTQTQVRADLFPTFIDVRDLARAHVAALKPACGNKRYFIQSGQLLMHDVVEIMKRNYDLPMVQAPEKPATYWRVDTSRFAADSGFQPEVELERCVVDTTERMKELKTH